MSIALKSVWKIFTETKVQVEALKDVDLRVETGEFVVVLGPSGSGKSTLLNVTGGLDTVSEGEIRIDEDILTSYGEKELLKFRRERLGFVFQQYHLLSTLNVAENVETGAYGVKNPYESGEALRMVGLNGYEKKYPFELSGGEQQRVSIARALVKKPSILFCDEPTGALDEKTGKAILSLLTKLHKELSTTVVLVTHNAGIAQIADRIVRMNSGRIVEDSINKQKVSPDKIAWH